MSILRPLFLVLAGCAAAAHGIVIRHDRTEAESLALARAFPAACRVSVGGSGVLIAPTWVLTAAHVANGSQANGTTVTIGGQTYQVLQALTNPQWRRGGYRDIGLLRLDRPVTGVKPLPFATKAPSPGAPVTIVGAGLFGMGDKGVGRTRVGAPTVHAGRNVVELTSQGRKDNTLQITLHEPPKGDALEAIGAPGDSGGPMLTKVRGQWTVIGVGLSGDDSNGDGKMADYGDHSFYTAVHPYVNWIRSTMGTPAPKEKPAGPQPWSAAAPRVLAAFFDAYNSGPPEYGQFFTSHNGNRQVPIQRRVEDYRGWIAQTGKLTPVRFIAIPGAPAQVWAKNSAGTIFAFMFDLDGDRILRMAFRPEG